MTIRQRLVLAAAAVFIGFAGPALLSAQSDIAVVACLAIALCLAWGALLVFQPTSTNKKDDNE